MINKFLKGFTLAELLVSVALLLFVLLAILQVFVHSCRLDESARNLSMATSHAEFVMEDIRNTPFSSIVSNGINGTWNYTTVGAITTAGLTALNNESIVTTVTQINTYLLDVTVAVHWRDTQQRDRVNVLESLISG